ncbi:hypothetical protein [uncultured Clostridium sp.]|uniref:hypothetical protein n=1 Tax=uncultured Clostridium sp. TaxID=59620 RepID=UPI0025CE807C|nr:hypothetical protein [uncultured Clostridium sp.]
MTINDLEKCYDEAVKNEENFVGVKIQMQGYPKPEIIINPSENFSKKLEYYKNSYNEDLTLKAFDGIKIIGCAHGECFEEIYDDLLR